MSDDVTMTTDTGFEAKIRPKNKANTNTQLSNLKLNFGFGASVSSSTLMFPQQLGKLSEAAMLEEGL